MKLPAPDSKLFLSIAILIITVVKSSLSIAHGSETITNGYLCEPKNPGGEATRLYFRHQNGVAVNLSSTATFPVVCPILIPFEEPPYEAGVTFSNGSSATQNFSCALEEYDILANLVRSTGKAVNIPPGGSNLIAYEGIDLLDDTNFLSLRCIIPPRGEVGLLTFF